MNDVPEIIIHVKGGVAEVVKKPLGVVLRIIDYDTGPNGECMRAIDSVPREEVWTEMDMTKEE